MSRRKKLPPDNRLNWRDPEMPVLRLRNDRTMMEVEPDWIKNYYEQKMASRMNGAPNWRNDSTYDLRKRK